MRKPDFAYAKTKMQISFAVTAKLISAFVFATRIVQSLYFLNPKFQASSHLLWLCSPICVGPGRKPRRPVFSQRGSNDDHTVHNTCAATCNDHWWEILYESVYVGTHLSRLSPPVILSYRPFQCETIDMFLYVACFGISFCSVFTGLGI